ncbi:MAG: T9SS type A sorting domain-containing protein [Bacteroidales bacterium]|nr:T9SS type A sorting domain-containing protein [Bacteroidales bacterium]
MKALFIVLISVFIISLNLNAQKSTYHAFPDSATWRVDHYLHNPFQMFYNGKFYFHYYFSGDTIINTTEYKKLFKSYSYFQNLGYHPSLTPPTSQPIKYMGALREDSLNNKVYFMFAGQTSDTLLYDYNLEVGDTLMGIPGRYYMYWYPIVVSSIDSVLIQGEYHTRWNFDTCDNYTPFIIEGIGSSSGLIEEICTYAIDFTSRYLVCMKNGDSTLFTHPTYSSMFGCSPIIESIEDHSTQNSFKYYPNPFTNDLHIETNYWLDNAKLILYDVSGKEVLTMTNLSGQDITIPRGDIPNGIYFIQITQNNIILDSEKVIITD